MSEADTVYWTSTVTLLHLQGQVNGVEFSHSNPQRSAQTTKLNLPLRLSRTTSLPVAHLSSRQPSFGVLVKRTLLWLYHHASAVRAS